MLGQKYFGTEELDRKLLEFLSPEKRGYFIEIGANNGIAQSNTKHLELFCGWSGLLVEPWKPNYDRLNITRSSRSTFVHAACVSFSFPHKEVSLYYSNLLTIAEGVESDKPDAFGWAKGAEYLIPNQERVSKFFAPARTLTSILDNSNAPRVIELFSLDVEGAEIEVLMGIDFEKYHFNVICVESENIARIDEFLSKKGFKLERQVTYHDYVFIQKDNVSD
jgi:FkbM family methyltransferase